MKKLHKLIITTYTGPFVLTFFITLFILVMQFLWKYIDDLVGKGLEWDIIAQLLFYASANLVPMALPLAVLLSSLMTFGSLGEHYELAALKSAGLSLPRIMLPLIIMIFGISLITFYFSNNIWPVANLKMASLMYDVRHKKPTLDIRSKVFYKGIDGYVIRAEKKDNDGQTLYGISIYDHTKKKGNVKVIKAKRGKMMMSEDERVLILSLFEGYSYEDVDSDNATKDNYPFFRSNFKHEEIRFDLSGFAMERSNEDLFKNNYQMLNISQLDSTIDTMSLKYERRFSEYEDMMTAKMPVLTDSLLVSKAPDSIAHINLLERNDNEAQFRILESAQQIARNNYSLTATLNQELRNKKRIIFRHEIEWHRKFTLSFACIVLFFIGAPLGAIIRKGGLGMPMVVSVLFFIFYHVMNMTGEKLVKQMELTASEGMWISSAILTPIGIFLTYKASTDSVLLDREFYLRLFRPINRLLSVFIKKTRRRL